MKGLFELQTAADLYEKLKHDFVQRRSFTKARRVINWRGPSPAEVPRWVST